MVSSPAQIICPRLRWDTAVQLMLDMEEWFSMVFIVGMKVIKLLHFPAGLIASK